MTKKLYGHHKPHVKRRAFERYHNRRLHEVRQLYKAYIDR